MQDSAFLILDIVREVDATGGLCGDLRLDLEGTGNKLVETAPRSSGEALLLCISPTSYPVEAGD